MAVSPYNPVREQVRHKGGLLLQISADDAVALAADQCTASVACRPSARATPSLYPACRSMPSTRVAAS